MGARGWIGIAVLLGACNAPSRAAPQAPAVQQTPAAAPKVDVSALERCCKQLAAFGMARGPEGNALVDLGGACDDMARALEQQQPLPELDYDARKDYLAWLENKQIPATCSSLMRQLIKPL